MTQMSNYNLLDNIQKQIDGLEREFSLIYDTLVLHHWGGEMHGFPQTLYGYVMCGFTFIDLLSAYWKGNDKDQSSRMLGFMNTYMRPEQEANSVAIQIWRHKLMHTAQPRPLWDSQSAKKYYWLIHWYKHLPEEQHYAFQDTADARILNIGLAYLIQDLKQAVVKYEEELLISSELRAKFLQFESELSSYKYRDITP